MSEKLTPIADLGEFALIDHLLKDFEMSSERTLKGAGDDAAVIDLDSKNCLLISTDSFIEGVHFDVSYTPMMHLGFKCISAAVSDIFAMNAMATQVTVSLALSSKYTLEAIDELYKGIRYACKHFQVDLVGGDTTSSKSGLFISVTAIGFASKERIAYRSGAKHNDLLCVTGDLGGAYVGLQVLEREKRLFLENPEVQPDLSGFDYMIKRQLRPESRKDIIEVFEELNLIPTSMIDISDGLSSEALHLCKESGMGCSIYSDKIPVDPQTKEKAFTFGLDPTMCALNGGEDYELLFTVKQTDFDKVNNHPDITIIGHITDAETGANLITNTQQSIPLSAQGWNHFKED